MDKKLLVDVRPFEISRQKIDESINQNLERYVFFEDAASSTILFKAINNRYLDHKDYDKMQDALREESKEADLYRLFDA